MDKPSEPKAMRLYLEAACKLPVVERTEGKYYQRLSKRQRSHCNFTPRCLRLSRLAPPLRR